MISTGLRADGHREVLGVDVGDSQNETFWTEFLRDHKNRGLAGVKLVISDAHAGLKAAIRTVFQGAAWQRCRTDVVQIFPNTESVIRLIGALLVEVNNEMLTSNRRYIAAASVPDITTTNQPLPGRHHNTNNDGCNKLRA